MGGGGGGGWRGGVGRGAGRGGRQAKSFALRRVCSNPLLMDPQEALGIQG